MTLDLNSIDNSYLLFVRSKEVEQISTNFNSNMKIDLQANIERDNAFQDIHVQLSSCEIPMSFYNFSSNLNNLNLNVNGTTSLQLTEQHYDIDELCDFITADTTFKFSATFYPQKNKIILTNTDSTGYTINFGNDASKNLAKALGFKQVDVVMSAGESIISDNTVNLNTIHSIFVHTNLSVTNVITTTSGNFRNILQKIPVNAEFGDMIQYNPYLSSQFSTVLNTNSVRSLELSLRDQNDNLIQFNNGSFELSLLFEIHSKEQPAPTLIETGGGRRRDDFIDFNPIQNINPPTPQQITQPNQQNINNTSNINNRRNLIKPIDYNNFKIPGIQNKIVNKSEVGYTSTVTKPVSNIVLPTINEDRELNDKQESELQDKLLQLELLDEII